MSKEEPKASKEEPRARCHAGDLAGCSSSKLTELIKKVSFQGKTYALTIEEVGDDEESVVSCKQSIGTCYCIVGCKSSCGLQCVYYKCFTVSFTPATKGLMT